MFTGSWFTDSSMGHLQWHMKGDMHHLIKLNYGLQLHVWSHRRNVLISGVGHSTAVLLIRQLLVNRVGYPILSIFGGLAVYWVIKQSYTQGEKLGGSDCTVASLASY